MKKTILVTGGAGYLGSIVCQKLLNKGYAVRCYDNLFYGDKGIEGLIDNKDFKLIKANTAYITNYEDEFKGCHAVIHLAELANDPSCDLEPEMTEIFNFHMPLKLANIAKANNVKKFIFGSSCSVYGQGYNEHLTEYAPLNPLTRYAESKVKVESELLKLADSDFCMTILRQATLFGYSKRMRFDLSVNIMTKHAFTDKKIIVLGGGKQWRPFLHVSDSADAFIKVLESDDNKVGGEIFNVESNDLNYEIVDLAREVKKHIPEIEIEIADVGEDRRSYRVNFKKINDVLGYNTKKTVKDGVMEILHSFQRGEFENGDDDVYYNIKSLKKMVSTPVIDGGEHLCYHYVPFSLPELGEEEEKEVIDTMRSGWLTTGPKTKKLEEMIADYVGAKHCIAVNSCTAALHLSLVGLGIGEGDEVTTSPITWPSTANVIVHAGATPVFVDIEKDTLNIDPSKIEEKITSKTKAIIPVHMAGQPCDMDKISKIAKKHKLIVIEDAAHAVGAEYKGKKIGSISKSTCFSFYPIKNMTTVEGGAVVTDDDEFAERVRVLSLHGVSSDAWKRYSQQGSTKHHEVVEPGFKYNMSDIQASFGLHQIEKLDNFIERRREITEIYNNYFKGIPEIITPEDVSYPTLNARHLYVVQLNLENLKIDRDSFMEALKKENVGVGIHFRSLHLQKYYKERFDFNNEDFPNASYVSDRILSLPLYPGLDFNKVILIAKIVKKLAEYYRK